MQFTTLIPAEDGRKLRKRLEQEFSVEEQDLDRTSMAWAGLEAEVLEQEFNEEE
jgi:hypothetical protein